MLLTTAASQVASNLQKLGAGVFGWYLFYLNRHRNDEVKFQDLVTLIGAVGGTAILALFPAKTDLFGAYGIGLFAGFFGYFLFMLMFVLASKNFNADFFLDGRRKKLEADRYIPRGGDKAAAMEAPGAGGHVGD